jgi:hypothetical protein
MLRTDQDHQFADTELACDWPPKDWPPRRASVMLTGNEAPNTVTDCRIYNHDWPVPPYGLGAINEMADDDADDPRAIPGAGLVVWLVIAFAAVAAMWAVFA